MKLYYIGQPGEGFGWGIANTNLIKHLKELCEVVCVPRSQRNFDAPVFAPIQFRDLKPDVPWKAPRVIGYCFTEWPLPENSKRNARAYDIIFAGSMWNVQRLKDAGIHHVDCLLQGIDASIFYPLPVSTRRGFIVFSGGKYEFRKAQDYVIEAMRLFMASHNDVVLLASWENQWKESIMSMRQSWLIDFDNPIQGLPEDRIILTPPISNRRTPDLYGQAHIGLFPNRCEAGTNLVMSEFMACSRPVIASYAHGHKDVLEPDYPLLLKTGAFDPAGWFNPEVSDIIAHLEWAYAHREQLESLGGRCHKMTQKLTWQACARKIYEAAFLQPAPQSDLCAQSEDRASLSVD